MLGAEKKRAYEARAARLVWLPVEPFFNLTLEVLTFAALAFAALVFAALAFAVLVFTSRRTLLTRHFSKAF